MPNNWFVKRLKMHHATTTYEYYSWINAMFYIIGRFLPPVLRSLHVFNVTRLHDYGVQLTISHDVELQWDFKSPKAKWNPIAVPPRNNIWATHFHVLYGTFIDVQLTLAVGETYYCINTLAGILCYSIFLRSEKAPLVGSLSYLNSRDEIACIHRVYCRNCNFPHADDPIIEYGYTQLSILEDKSTWIALVGVYLYNVVNNRHIYGIYRTKKRYITFMF